MMVNSKLETVLSWQSRFKGTDNVQAGTKPVTHSKWNKIDRAVALSSSPRRLSAFDTEIYDDHMTSIQNNDDEKRTFYFIKR